MSETTKKCIYGIDLGTTYSAIAFMNDANKPEIICNMEGDKTTPSVVFFEKPEEEGKVGKVVVGKVAKQSAGADSSRAISFVKQEMGTSWTKEIDGLTLTPEKVSAYILKAIVEDAKQAGHDVKDVVITCPAYFGDAERKATREAGEIAGLNVVQILDEPIAAAMHYGLNKAEGKRTAIIYDLGGGTFDVTVVSIDNGNVDTVCTDGNHRLGGKLWDEKIVENLAAKFAAATGVDYDSFMADNDTVFDLQLKAEDIKRTLSRKESAKTKITFEGNSETVEITRSEFDEITKDLLDQTEFLTQKMFELAKQRGVEKINDFLLVGGSTYMPQVKEMVHQKFASLVDNEPEPFEVNEAVAKGAANFGFIEAVKIEVEKAKDKGKEGIKGVGDEFGLLPDQVEDIIKTEVTTVASRSYGIRVVNKNGEPVVYNMIKKQDQVPASFEREFPLTESNAEKLPLLVFANNIMDQVASLEDSVEHGNAVMMLPPNLQKGSPIRVKFSLSKEGILELDALDVTHGTQVQAVFESKDGLTEEEVKKATVETAGLQIES